MRLSLLSFILVAVLTTKVNGIVCPLCGEGSSPISNPDAVLISSLFNDFTGGLIAIEDCLTLETLLNTFDHPGVATCSEVDPDGFLLFFQNYCGCPNADPVEITCPGVCVDGAAFDQPDQDITALGTVGVDTSALVELGISTCEEVDFVARYAGGLGANISAAECQELLFGNVVPNLCGCENAGPLQGTYPQCNLCSETEVLRNPDSRVSGQGQRCGDFEQAGFNGLIAPTDCPGIQYLSTVCGGCVPIPTPPPTPSPLPENALDAPPPTPPPATSSPSGATAPYLYLAQLLLTTNFVVTVVVALFY